MFDVRKMQEHAIYEAVRIVSDDATAKEVVYGDGEDAEKKENAVWVDAAMERLEKKFDPETPKQIRMHCQCGYGMDEKLALLQDLIASSTNMEEFANSEKARAAGLFYQNGELFLQFFFCPCPMVAEIERLKTNTWCQCTTGYSKTLFQKAFHCEVDVELLKSIKTGDDICLMKIIPHGQIW